MTRKNQPLKELVSKFEYLQVLPGDLIRDVACQMPKHHTSAATVIDKNGALVGIITEYDIVQKAVGLRRNVDETVVEKIMTRDPVTISIDESSTEALKLMTEHGFRTLPVMDGKSVVGIIDIRDLFEALSKILEEEISLKEGLLSYAFGNNY